MNQANTLQKALAHHRAKRLVEARAIYKLVLAFNPNNIDALHLLGVLENEIGQYDDALSLISRALYLQPDFAEAQNSLGNVYKNLEDWANAETAYKCATQIEPQFVGAYLNLSLVARKQGNFRAALRACDKAITINPSLLAAFFNKANALSEMKRLKEAINIYRKILAQDAHYTEAKYNLGITLHELGNNHFKDKRWNVAISMYREAITMGVSTPSLQNNLGSALNAMGQMQEAIGAFSLALKLDPTYAPSHNNLGIMFESLGEFEEALKSYRKAIEYQPEFLAAMNNMGNTLRSLGRIDEAIKCYQSALAIDPDFLDATFNMGNAEKENGNFTRAIQLYSKVLASAPEHPAAIRQLASLGALNSYKLNVPRLRKKLNNDISDLDRTELAFALAKLDEYEGRLDDMFKMLEIGNATKRNSLNYDSAETGSYLQSIAKVFSSEALFKNKDGFQDETPIFIVGMPRSGTSLVEQILASHPDVFGAGEMMITTNLAESIGYPENAINLHSTEKIKLGETYTKRIRVRSKDALRITDKMPHNFLYLGLIKMILPKARIIHCTRSPEDTCFSLYKNLFTDHLDFAYDFRELGSYFGYYASLMEHWQAVMPDGFLNLSYETLVQEQETETRRLLDYLALPWDNACLDFHKTIRQVTTASTTQVRKKLYINSIDSWRRYEKYLSPLLTSIPSPYRSKK